ncbi:formate/nitrite transporter family protein [Vagococcus vulneris]|uniref:Formate-nitrite transporter n=1 Tax=Vagococcus vulneris TaxID=1977869 RepID=A0A429ZX30_9ENTE|nr:formate/nitrite transporter family protein [Vagococcus vulneris]RST98398.1 formate-nitrite transporter [Vagococcus vulneris]
MKSKSPMFEKIDATIAKKIELLDNHYARYATRAVLACLFLSLGTAIAFSVATYGEAIVPNLGKFLFSFMFSWSLVMILYMNAELGTSNMLYATSGVYRKEISATKGMKLLFTCVFFNLVGGVFFAYLISLTGPFQNLPADNYMFTGVAAKLAKPSLQIFVEGIFANVVVNTAVLVSLRMRDDAGKVLAIIFIISIFAFLGYEHVIANFTAFPLAYFASHGTVEGMEFLNVSRNIIFAFLGNYVGGGLLIGLVYSWLDRQNTGYVD